MNEAEYSFYEETTLFPVQSVKLTELPEEAVTRKPAAYYWVSEVIFPFFEQLLNTSSELVERTNEETWSCEEIFRFEAELDIVSLAVDNATNPE